MADEENINAVENVEKQIVGKETEIDYQDFTKNANSIDWDNVWGIVKKTINYSSITAAYLGIFAILSYPVLHIINYFCHIDKFMKNLPFGYTAATHKILLISFGIICLFTAFKLTLWLIQQHSVTSRIFCILLGSGFMYAMIDKYANEILMAGVLMIFAAIMLVFVTIPFLIMLHNTFLPVFKGLVPSVFTYYKFLFSFFPKTSGLIKFCDSAKNSVEATNARYAEEYKAQKAERERQREKEKAQEAEREMQREKEKQERETICSAVQNGNWVNVYGLKGNILFSRTGTLRGYTSSSVNIEYSGFVTTYNGRGSVMYSRSAK